MDGHRPEPRWLTPLDLVVLVAAIALVMTMPSRTTAWPIFLPPPPLFYLLLLGGFRLALEFGPILALVVLVRRTRYGGPVRSAERLVLALGSLSLLEAIPNLDEAVNAYHAATGRPIQNFGAARWLVSTPAVIGVILIEAGLMLLQIRFSKSSRFASAATVLGVVCGLALWFWGPCEVIRLELPWLLVPAWPGGPGDGLWLDSLLTALRQIVAHAPMSLTWGIIGAAALRSWRPRTASWIEWAAVIDALVCVLILALIISPAGPAELARLALWIVSVALVSWWITGRFPAEPIPAKSTTPAA